ncbi:MAG: hypothetical protein QNJ17_14865 [Desulfocapsaceae bacterium]|nr:hypothetical protein [Desulfocapsaceae bacterium]
MPYKFAESLMTMNEEVWRRHANPWSGWTRVATFPFWFLAIWSWVWIGWWALVPIILLSIWTWLNPRVFPPCQNDHAWITRGVLGERLFLNRRNVSIPAHHVKVAHLLTAMAGLFMVAAIIGFVTKNFWLALGGWLLTITFKMWFVDRMVWIYETMKEESVATGTSPSMVETQQNRGSS